MLVQPDDFASQYQRADSAGEVHDVPTTRDRVDSTRPGDVLVSPFLGAGREQLIPAVYRPSEDRVLRLPPGAPLTNGPDAVALDDQGGVWVLRSSQKGFEVQHSADGTAPWESTTREVAKRTLVQALIIEGGLLYLPGLTDRMEAGLVSLRSRDVAGSDDFADVDLSGVDGQDWFAPSITAVEDGRILIGDYSDDWYLGTDGDFVRVELPGPGDDWFLEYAEGRLYALGSGPAYVSDDLGGSWSELPR